MHMFRNESLMGKMVLAILFYFSSRTHFHHWLGIALLSQISSINTREVIGNLFGSSKSLNLNVKYRFLTFFAKLHVT